MDTQKLDRIAHRQKWLILYITATIVSHDNQLAGACGLEKEGELLMFLKKSKKVLILGKS